MIPAKKAGPLPAAIAPPPKAAATPAVADDFARMPAIDAIGPGKALYKEYRDPHTLALYRNWRFFCPHKGPGHGAGCMRTVGVIPKNTRWGELEPIAYLHAWRDTPPDLAKGHRKTPPPKAKVKAFLDAHTPQLQAMRDHFATP